MRDLIMKVKTGQQNQAKTTIFFLIFFPFKPYKTLCNAILSICGCKILKHVLTY